ncbi:MAG: hypothetical protein E7401_00025 [Ruminococcaceae bacterium]|nr:hypothetical protein [Oscillospiraceae bacterium]
MKLSKQLSKIFEIPIGKHLKISIWLIPTVICAIYGGYVQTFVVAYLSAILHETAHIIWAKALSVSVSRVELYPFGISARLKSGYIQSSEKEFLIAFAGPSLSLLLYWVCIILYRFIQSEFFKFGADINLCLCLINLIPVLPLDGGRIVKALLTARYGIIRAYNFTIKLSRFLILLLLICAGIIFFVSDFNFSLILISAFLLQNLCGEQQAVSTVTLREILQSTEKAENCHSLPVRTLCVKESRAASGILRYLSYDCFYIVHILNKKSRIIKTLTETQILMALTENGIRTRYGDI